MCWLRHLHTYLRRSSRWWTPTASPTSVRGTSRPQIWHQEAPVDGLPSRRSHLTRGGDAVTLHSNPLEPNAHRSAEAEAIGSSLPRQPNSRPADLPLSLQAVLFLQRAAGNRAVCSWIGPAASRHESKLLGVQLGRPAPERPQPTVTAGIQSVPWVQRVLTIGSGASAETFRTSQEADTLWQRLRPTLNVTSTSEQTALKKVLVEWVAGYPTISGLAARLGWWPQNRVYDNDGELCIALKAEVAQSKRKASERELASRARTDPKINTNMASLMRKLADYIHLSLEWAKGQQADSDVSTWSKIGEIRGDWKWWTPWFGSILDELASPTEGYKLNFAYFRNVAYKLPGLKIGIVDVPGTVSKRRRAPIGADFRHGVYNVKESHHWVAYARRRNLPLSAGPSNTMVAMYRAAEIVGASDDEMNALAWSGFIFYTLDFFSSRSATHTLHEIMDIGREFGVTYSPHNYAKLLNSSGPFW